MTKRLEHYGDVPNLGQINATSPDPDYRIEGVFAAGPAEDWTGKEVETIVGLNLVSFGSEALRREADRVSVRIRMRIRAMHLNPNRLRVVDDADFVSASLLLGDPPDPSRPDPREKPGAWLSGVGAFSPIFLTAELPPEIDRHDDDDEA